MKFALQVNSSPYETEGSDSAYQFVCAAIAGGHQVFRVFFYHDGIYNAFRHALPPADERPVIRRWSRLAREHGIDLVVCVSAAQRRGLLSLDEALRMGKNETDLAEGFRISGLGQLLEATIECDRFLVFGN